MNNSIKFLLAVCIVFSLAGFVSADVMPENAHILDRCIKIDNLNDFPNVVLVSYITGPMIDNHESYVINTSQCLDKGYKFNQFQLFAVDSVYLKNKGIDNINFLSDSKVFELGLTVDPYGGTLDNSNPLKAEDITYSLTKTPDNKIVIFESKHVSKYNNKTPDKVDVFEAPSASNPHPTPKQQGFFASIACFFKSLFGGVC